MAAPLYAQWQNATTKQWDELKNKETGLSQINIFSPQYQLTLKVLSDDPSYISQIRMEYPTSEKNHDATFAYLTIAPLNERKMVRGAVDAFVNIEEAKIHIQGVPHYGYFKSVLLGAFGFAREKLTSQTSIHAALISSNGKGILFVAPAGKGKSTYSLSLRNTEKYRFITDDWVMLDADQARGYRGDNFIRLSPTALRSLDANGTLENRSCLHPQDIKHELQPELIPELPIASSENLTHLIILGKCEENIDSILDAVEHSTYHLPFNFPSNAHRPHIRNDAAKILNFRRKSLRKIISALELACIDPFEQSEEETTKLLKRRVLHG